MHYTLACARDDSDCTSVENRLTFGEVTDTNLVWEHATKDTSAEQEQLVALLRECIMIRDNVFTLPNFYTVADAQCITSYVCSSG